MADEVQKRLESTLPEMQSLLQDGIFSREEIRSITAKRKQFEYSVRSYLASKDDYFAFIDYETQLEVLRRRRKERLGMTKSKSVHEYSIVGRISGLYEKVVTKYGGDVSVWMRYADFCKRVGNETILNRIYVRALQLHPRNDRLWVAAAAHEYEENGDIYSARALFQRGIRANPKSKTLYTEYFRLETLYALKLRDGISEEDAALGGAEADSGSSPEEAPEEQKSEEAAARRAALKKIADFAVPKAVVKAAAQALDKGKEQRKADSGASEDAKERVPAGAALAIELAFLLNAYPQARPLQDFVLTYVEEAYPAPAAVPVSEHVRARAGCCVTWQEADELYRAAAAAVAVGDAADLVRVRNAWVTYLAGLVPENTAPVADDDQQAAHSASLVGKGIQAAAAAGPPGAKAGHSLSRAVLLRAAEALERAWGPQRAAGQLDAWCAAANGPGRASPQAEAGFVLGRAQLWQRAGREAKDIRSLVIAVADSVSAPGSANVGSSAADETFLVLVPVLVDVCCSVSEYTDAVTRLLRNRFALSAAAAVSVCPAAYCDALTEMLSSLTAAGSGNVGASDLVLPVPVLSAWVDRAVGLGGQERKRVADDRGFRARFEEAVLAPAETPAAVVQDVWLSYIRWAVAANLMDRVPSLAARAVKLVPDVDTFLREYAAITGRESM